MKFNTYRVVSGDMDIEIKTPCKAEAEALAMRALLAAHGSGTQRLSRLTQVSGGQYRGKQAVYLSTEKLLQSMGLMQ